MQVRAGKHLPDALMGPIVADLDRRSRIAGGILIDRDPGERQVVDRGFRRRRREHGAVIARVRLDLDCARAMHHEVAADRYRGNGRVDQIDSGRDGDALVASAQTAENAATMADVSSVEPSPAAVYSRMLTCSTLIGQVFVRPGPVSWRRN